MVSGFKHLDPEWLLAPITQKNSYPDFLRVTLREYAMNGQLAHLASLVFDSTKQRIADFRYVFYGCKFSDILLGLPREEVVVIGGPKEWLFCRKHGIAFFSFCGCYGSVTKAIHGIPDSLQVNDRLLKDAFSGATEQFLVVGNDTLPPSRFLVGAFKAAVPVGKVICIQHGIFQIGRRGSSIEGQLADLNMVYSGKQGQVLINNGVAEESIRVLGFSSDYVQDSQRPEVPKICLLGEGWHKYDRKLGDIYFGILKKLMLDFQKTGLKVVFRPHPSDNRRQCYSEFKYIDSQPLQKSLKDFDIWIGLASTVLIEAVMAGKFSVQVRHGLFSMDNYKDEGYCESLDACEATVANILDLYTKGFEGQMVSPTEPSARRFLAAISGY